MHQQTKLKIIILQTLNSFFRSINNRLSSVSRQGKRELRSATAKVQIASGDLRAFISQVI